MSNEAKPVAVPVVKPEPDEVSKAACRLLQQLTHVPIKNVTQQHRDIWTLVNHVTAPPSTEELREEIERLKAELECERMRLAACGVLAASNTKESAERERNMHADYWSASAGDVVDAVDREMAYRDRATAAEAEVKRLRDALEAKS